MSKSMLKQLAATVDSLSDPNAIFNEEAEPEVVAEIIAEEKPLEENSWIVSEEDVYHKVRVLATAACQLFTGGVKPEDAELFQLYIKRGMLEAAKLSSTGNQAPLDTDSHNMA